MKQEAEAALPHIPLDPEAPDGVARVVRTGEPELIRNLSDSHAGPFARGASFERLGVTSSAVVPLMVEARMVGALAIGWIRPSRSPGEADLRTAEEYARRAAPALENARVHRQAVEAVRVREDLLAIAAHELKTPITALELYLEVVASAVGRAPAGQRSAAWVKAIDSARRQIRRLTAMIDRLLDLPRLASETIELERDEIDLAALVQEVLEELRPDAARAGVPIRFESRGSALGRWDRIRLEQVVVNLVTNALRYGAGQPVGVLVSGETAAATIRVSDSGQGIPPEELEAIFGRYRRGAAGNGDGDGNGGAHARGLGLGLYISRQIVRALGGSIAVESKVGAGSTFIVTLPVDAARSRPGAGTT